MPLEVHISGSRILPRLLGAGPLATLIDNVPIRPKFSVNGSDIGASGILSPPLSRGGLNPIYVGFGGAFILSLLTLLSYFLAAFFVAYVRQFSC